MADEAPRHRAERAIQDALAAADLRAERPQPGVYVVALPGEHKVSTPCALLVREHTVSVNAFVARRPDENHDEVYRLLLQRNARLNGVAFALDRLGDVYLVGRLPVEMATPDTIDAVLGAVAQAADEVFDRLLATGFESAIRKEWAWRQQRGDDAANLEPFRSLLNLDPAAD